MTGLEIIALVGVVSASIVVGVAVALGHKVRARGRHGAYGTNFDLRTEPPKRGP